MSGWVMGDGPHNDIILSSRIRLARNISGVPFPTVLSGEGSHDVISMVKNSYTDNKNRLLYMQDQNPVDRQVMVERHVISPGLVKNTANAAAIVSDDESLSIMINEEDHI